MYADVLSFCKRCADCAVVTGGGRQHKPPLRPIPVETTLSEDWCRHNGSTLYGAREQTRRFLSRHVDEVADGISSTRPED